MFMFIGCRFLLQRNTYIQATDAEGSLQTLGSESLRVDDPSEGQKEYLDIKLLSANYEVNMVFFNIVVFRHLKLF